MSKEVLAIDNEWEFTWTAYVGRNRDVFGTHPWDGAQKWFPATVPGNVQWDLHKLGILDDPFFADNADHYRWCEEVDFWYRRKLPKIKLSENQRAILHFEGLDCFATVWIDGKEVGKHSNMFVPYWIDITEYLKADEQAEIVIRLASTFQEVERSQRDPNMHPPIERTRIRKAQISFGWDIGPRLVTVGIWRPVRLEIIESGRILYAGARTIDIKDNSAYMEFVATIDWHDRPSRVKVVANYDGKEISADLEVNGGMNDVVIPFAIDNPRLWWPKGKGKQNLYDMNVKIILNDKILDEKQTRFGICKVEKVEEPREDGGLGFRLKVNNADYLAKGLNWTPSDALLGRITDDRIRELVKLASDANVNMFRVWGGGVYEPESFFRACEEEGILVWQDFMFACSLYPQDQEFINEVKYEVEKIVRMYRGYVALALWSGDNEIDAICGPEAGTLISRKTIPEVLKKLDPHRPYIPSSPFSVPGKDPNDKKYGDVHLWNHTIRHDDKFYTDPIPNFVSEIGRISLPSKTTIDSFMPKDKQWPVDNSLWLYHSSDTNRWGIYRNIYHVLECVKNCGYPEPKSLDELIEVTQQIQADACKFWIEFYGNSPQCWGLLIWNLCDCWPQVSDAAIVSHQNLEKKKAYYAIKDAYGKLNR